MEGPGPSSPDLASSIPSTGRSLAPDPAEFRAENATSTSESAYLTLDHQPTHPSLPTYHVRAPSVALTVETELRTHSTPNSTDAPYNSSTVEGTDNRPRRQSATTPIPIQEGRLRSVWSTTSLTSLSPGSALSSPALNALGDITPLPSPLVMSDSPGPWQRAAPRPRSRSRGASASSRDESLPFFSHGNVSPSPSLKKKGYQKLKTAMNDAAAVANTPNNNLSPDRIRSTSEYTPETLHNARTRQVTIGSTAADTGGIMQQHMHREEYLATQRGLVPAKIPVGLPTPPASNASNRSVTDTEEEDLAEDDKTRYIVVRHGLQKTKKLWRPVRQLGQGTFSKVYLATCERTAAKDPLDENTLDPRKLVAIKVCEHGPAGGADEQRVELSLKREVEMLRSVSHPSLIHLQAFDHNDAQALIVLTYCPGGDLFDAASAHRDVLTADFVQRIFAEMVSAVRYLHTQFIVHRDIKLESTVTRLLRASIKAIFVCVTTNSSQMSS